MPDPRHIRRRSARPVRPRRPGFASRVRMPGFCLSPTPPSSNPEGWLWHGWTGRAPGAGLGAGRRADGRLPRRRDDSPRHGPRSPRPRPSAGARMPIRATDWSRAMTAERRLPARRPMHGPQRESAPPLARRGTLSDRGHPRSEDRGKLSAISFAGGDAARRRTRLRKGPAQRCQGPRAREPDAPTRPKRRNRYSQGRSS